MGRRTWVVRDLVEIYRHWQDGKSIRTIAKRLGIDRNTVRKYVRAAQEAGISRRRPLTVTQWQQFIGEQFPEIVERRRHAPLFLQLEPLKEEIAEALQTNRASTVWQRLRDADRISVSLSTFRRYVRATLPDVARRPLTVWRPEVEPGEEGQVDFVFLGTLANPATGRRQRVRAFILVLSYSRPMYVQPVTQMDQRTWLACHVLAFEFLGGAPRRLLLDNLKDGVLKPDLYDPKLNRAYKEMARHYRVLLDPCRAGHPKDKARVERMGSYIKESFWRGRRFADLAEATREARRWCREVAGMRLHRTTGQRPLEPFEREEKPALLPLPEQPWEWVRWARAKVGPDCHCQVGGVLYSVPARYRGEELEVRIAPRFVPFYRGEELVKTHVRRPGERRQTDPADLPPEKVASYERTPQWCLRQARNIGESAFECLRQLLAESTLTHLRQAQGILRLAETYGTDRLEAACRRALAYGDPRYRTVKGILASGADQGPLTPQRDQSGAKGAFLHGPQAFAPNGFPREKGGVPCTPISSNES